MRAVRRATLAALLIAPSLLFASSPVHAVSANPSLVCSNGTCSITFTYTGDYYSWSAPSTGTYTLEVWGAKGGGSGANYWGTGGSGGYAKGDLTLTNGQTLYIYPGQQGFQSATTNAFNGGGKANSSTSWGNGWTGGGATHIATSLGQLSSLSANTSSVKIVAGGGGGAAGSQGNASWSVYAANGGAGGGTVGAAGTNSNNDAVNRSGGGGGTQSAGGASVSPDVASGFGRGADAPALDSDGIQGGGGGGGWYGGGAGVLAGGGGGGGSGYIGGVTNTTITAGSATMPNPSGGTMTGNSGNGIARITYPQALPVITTSIAGNVKSVSKGQIIQVTANVDQAGTVTFYVDGKRIPGCISMTTSGGNVTCNWKPATLKSVRITASIFQSGVLKTTSSVLNVSTAKRAGTR